MKKMDKQIIEIVYKGIAITYNEDDEVYSCEIADYTSKRQSLKSLKQLIDKHIKTEDSFVPVKAYMFTYDSPKTVFVVSHIVSTSYGNRVWIKDEKGKRTKEDIERLYEWNKENELIFKKADKLESEIDKLRDEKEKLLKSLKHFKI